MSAKELEVNISEMSLRWTVEVNNRSKYQDVDSSEFQFQGGRWKLKYNQGGPYHALYLRKCSVQPLPQIQPFHISVHLETSRKGGIVNVLSHVTRFTTHFKSANVDRLVWRKREEEILRAVPEMHLYGVLKLGGSLTCSYQDTKTFTDASVQTRLDACSLSSLDTLSEDISGLQDSDLNPDVELRCEGLTVRAHRALLSVRSPVLATMLQADMEEGRTGIVHIRGMEEDTFQCFLNHLHTGKPEHESLSFDEAFRLYEAGKMYQVDSLSAICSQILVQNLTADNACEVLVTADAHADSHLEEAATRYMLENKIPQPGNERWDAFSSSHQHLAFKVANRYITELTGSSAPPT